MKKIILIFFLTFNITFAEAELLVQSSTIEEAFINEQYLATFFIENKGNESVIIKANLINISLPFNPLLTNPSSMNPNTTSMFGFEFNQFNCSDYLKEYHPILNISYTSSSDYKELIVPFNFTIKSPFELTLKEPLTTTLTIPLNSLETIILFVRNKGLSEHSFNISASRGSLLVNYLIDSEHYTNEFVSNNNFEVRSLSTKPIKITIIPSFAGINNFEFNITESSGCDNTTSSLTFNVNSYIRGGAFSLNNTPSINSLSITLLIIIVLIFTYHNLIK